MTAGVRARDGYLRLARRRLLLLAGLALLLAAGVVIDLTHGPARLGVAEVVAGLLDPGRLPLQARVVLWEIRLPGALMAVVVGAALSLAGAVMQTILNNPLASPFTLGISAAAGFGAALGLAFGVAVLPVAAYAVPLNALAMAMLTAAAIHALSLRRGVTAETIVLLGIALVFTFNALLALVQYFASERAVAAIVFWTLGSLTKATWESLGVTVLVVLLVLPLLARRVWALTALRLGDDKAASFGVNVRRLRLQSMLAVSLLAAFPVAFVGTIGFVGLAAPHAARAAAGEDQRVLMPLAAVVGALMLTAASVAAKLLSPGAALPVGIVTALIGVPMLFALVLRRGAGGRR